MYIHICLNTNNTKHTVRDVDNAPRLTPAFSLAGRTRTELLLVSIIAIMIAISIDTSYDNSR